MKLVASLPLLGLEARKVGLLPSFSLATSTEWFPTMVQDPGNQIKNSQVLIDYKTIFNLSSYNHPPVL